MKVLFFLLLIVNSALAQTDCAPVNLVTEKNSPFKHMPVYDQDGLGICYAYAAAQLIDYELIKKGNKGRSIHPLWGALKYADIKNQDNISMGTTYHTVKALMEKGNCQYDNFDKAMSEWTKKANASEAEVMGLIEKLAHILPKVKANEVDAFIAQTIEQHSQYCAGNPTWDQLMPELRSLSTMTSRDMLSGLVLPVCKKTNKLKVSSPRFANFHEDDLWPGEINKKIDELKAPLAISYCARGLYDESYDGVDRKTETTPLKVKPNCSEHESMIVGKKKIAGKCHFLLRNTWGNGFHNSNQNRKCLCKSRKTGKYLDDCEEKTHNDGDNIVEGCWIDQDVFSKNAFGMSFLQDKK